MKIFINTDAGVHTITDKEGTPAFLEKFRVGPHYNIVRELNKRGIYTEHIEEADVVLNIDSIYNNGIKKGKKLTIYWEVDDFMMCGKNPQFYEQADLLYINMSEYINNYPPGTKILRMAVDPEVIKEYPVEKDFDYVFIGSIEPLPVYHERLLILDKLLKISMHKGLKVLISHGLGEEYPKLLSRGKIILDTLPIVPESGNICIHQKLYEAMAVGCVMMPYHPFLDKLFIKDVHYVTIDRFGQISDEEIQRVKTNARKLIIEKHTWAHRVDQLLADIYEKLS